MTIRDWHPFDTNDHDPNVCGVCGQPKRARVHYQPRATKREYSREFSPTGEMRSYTISRIPAGLWQQVQRKAKREGVSLRALVLRHLSEWAATEAAAPAPAVDALVAQQIDDIAAKLGALRAALKEAR
jgi:hypothetical protein